MLKIIFLKPKQTVNRNKVKVEMKSQCSPVVTITNKAAYGCIVILLEPDCSINRNETVEYLVIVTTEQNSKSIQNKGHKWKESLMFSFEVPALLLLMQEEQK